MRQDQLTKNRASNIQWGLKVEVTANDGNARYSQKTSPNQVMNSTFTNMKDAGSSEM